MPSFYDSAFIFFIALLLFGPKKLPELARYVGKLMAEFRRASNEFRTQMEDELRVAEQAEQQKQIEALEAAAPVAPIAQDIPEPEHPHLDPPLAAAETIPEHHIDSRDPTQEAPGALGLASETWASKEAPAPNPPPIATSGDLSLYPPATGLPQPRTSSSSTTSNPMSAVFDSIPHAPETETPTHG